MFSNPMSQCARPESGNSCTAATTRSTLGMMVCLASILLRGGSKAGNVKNTTFGPSLWTPLTALHCQLAPPILKTVVARQRQTNTRAPRRPAVRTEFIRPYRTVHACNVLEIIPIVLGAHVCTALPAVWSLQPAGTDGCSSVECPWLVPSRTKTFPYH